jgi:hypothetical protein
MDPLAIVPNPPSHGSRETRKGCCGIRWIESFQPIAKKDIGIHDQPPWAASSSQILHNMAIMLRKSVN